MSNQKTFKYWIRAGITVSTTKPIEEMSNEEMAEAILFSGYLDGNAYTPESDVVSDEYNNPDNEVEFDLTSEPIGKEPNTSTLAIKPDMKPYMFYVTETIDGYEVTTRHVEYTNDPSLTAKEVVFMQCRDIDTNEAESVKYAETEWCDDTKTIELTTKVTCDKWFEITQNEAVIFNMANNIRPR